MTEELFEKLHTSDLNPQQKEAVSAVEGPVLLLAVPGSGKTTVLVKRLGYMLYVSEIPPERILTMTYTVAATKEMRARFSAEFGNEFADFLEFRTINSLSQNIIDYYGRTCSRRRPFDIEGDDGRLSAIVRNIYIEVNQEYPDDSTVRDVRTAITFIKNRMLTAEEIESFETDLPKLPELYRRYNAVLRENGKMDYDDQIIYAYAILRTRPQVLQYFQSRFVYVCVDEAQDTSKIQHAMIRLLTGKYRNVFMVGDEDQSIYGFRAAEPEALLRFKEDYPGARVLYLEKNYRSTPEIVDMSNRFIERNRSRYPKTAAAVRQSGKQPDRIVLSRFSAQYSFLCDVAEKSTRETAVLFRNNDSAIPLIDLFERKGIRYNCRAFDETFFTNRLVADIRSICEFSSDRENTELFLQLYYKFGCGINKKAALAAVEEHNRSGEPLLKILCCSPFLKSYSKDSVSNLSMHLRLLQTDKAETALKRIWTAAGYGEYARRLSLDEHKYDILCVLAKDVPDLRSLFLKLDKLRTMISGHINSAENRMILSTIHSGKGLEYDIVYLIDAVNGILPSNAKDLVATDEEKAEYEEDRRIFYVGMTRAKNELHIVDTGKKSDFLDEVFPPEPITVGDVLKNRRTGTSQSRRDDGTVIKNGLKYEKQ